MESVTLRAPTKGLTVSAECFATGAEKNPTKATKDLPEAERRYWYRMHLAATEDGERTYAFCEEEHATTVAEAIKATGAATPVEVRLALGRDSINVVEVKIAGGRK